MTIPQVLYHWLRQQNLLKLPQKVEFPVVGPILLLDSPELVTPAKHILEIIEFSITWNFQSELSHMQACTFKLDCWLSPITALGLLFESMLGAKSRFAIGSSVHKIRCNLKKEKWSFFVKHHREREKKSRALGESLLKKKTHFKLFGKWTCIISGTVS